MQPEGERFFSMINPIATMLQLFYILPDWSDTRKAHGTGRPAQPSNLKSVANGQVGCLGPDGSSRWVGSRCDSSRCDGSHSVSTQATGPFACRHSKTDMPFFFYSEMFMLLHFSSC